MRRWTDGKSWSASRVSGSFLTYREMEGKRGGNSFGPPLAAVSRAGRTPDSTRGSDSDLDMGGEDGPDGYRYKPDGLMKQSFSITTSSGNHLHLISYYSRSHPSASGLTSPTSDPSLRHIRPQKGMYPESTVHEHQNIPAVTRSPMVSAPYSTVPQMAGYARQGPPPHPQWSPHYNGYNWAPPPQMQQAGSHYGYQQYNGSGVVYGPQPPINGHSPLQNSQSAAQPPPATQPYDAHYQPYDQRRYPSMSSSMQPDMSSYEQRQGPPTTSQPQRPTDRYGPPSELHNGYDPRYAANQGRNPLPPSDSNLAPLQQTHGRNGSSANGMQRSQSQHHHHSPHMSHTPPSNQHPQGQQLTSLSTPIDPRLMASSPMVPQQPPPNHLSRTSTPAAHTQLQEAAEATQSHTNGTNGASTIPSIGAIMNGASAESHNSPNADAKSDRSGDKTPGGSVKKEGGPQDIPSDKLGFGEDMRALKVLDRAFKT